MRDAALGVQRPVDRVEHDASGTPAPEGLLPDLLGHEQEVATGGRQALDDHRLGGCVDGSRVVASLARADDRLAQRPRG